MGSIPPRLHLSHLANRTILLVGGSTMRMMATDLMMQTHRTQMAAFGEGTALRRQLTCPSSWRVAVHPCDALRGFGCTNCVCCCGPNCARRRAEEATNISNAANWKNLFFGWSDFTATCSSYSLRLDFSWKPEMHTADDDAAFNTRFCASSAQQYDIAIIGKGLHDVMFRPAPLGAFVARLVSEVAALGALVQCLPQSTSLMVRTPYWVDDDLGKRPRRSTTGLLVATADIVRAAVASGRFGRRAQLIDAFALTRGQEGALRSYDGIHYPPLLQMAVWDMVMSKAVGE